MSSAMSPSVSGRESSGTAPRTVHFWDMYRRHFEQVAVRNAQDHVRLRMHVPHAQQRADGRHDRHRHRERGDQDDARRHGDGGDDQQTRQRHRHPAFGAVLDVRRGDHGDGG